VIVLPKQSGELWRFFGIRFTNGTQPIDDWFLNDLSEEAQLALIAALKDAQKIENLKDWTCFRRYMKGDLAPHRIWEIGFSCGDGRAYRALGVCGSERKQAIFLMGYYHKGNTYTPQDALESALRRAKQLARNEVTVYERKLPTNR
jgi:hypothetical protein